jgi:aryl-alcohol dehydrogenase-like predicted oxidoreductase
VPLVSVQNRYNLSDRGAEGVLEHCQTHGIGFIPWFPMASGKLVKKGGPLRRVSDAVGASPGQVALAWLLHKSPVMLPIPGTSTRSHLEENCAAAGLELDDSQMALLDGAVA